MHSFKKAIELHQSGDILSAQNIYKAICENDQTNVQALHLLGVTHAQTGDLNQALLILNRALELSPKDPAIHNNRGNILRTNGNPVEAIKSFKTAIEIKPDYAEAFNNLGNSLQDLNDITGAIEAYKTAIHLQPNYTEAVYNMGIALQNQNDHEAAIKYLKLAIEQQPEISKFHIQIATSLIRIGILNDATAHAQKALILDPQAPEALTLNGNIANLHLKYHEAIDFYDKAIEINPRSQDAYCSRAISKCKIGLSDEALADCKKAIEINPNNTQARNNIASIKITKGDNIAAEIEARRSLQIDPKNDEALVILGALLSLRFEFDSATKLYTQALEINPRNADAHFCLGLLHQNKKRFKIALNHFEEAHRLDPNRDFVIGSQIECKMAQCDWDGVENLAKRIKEMQRFNLRPAFPLTICGILDEPLTTKLAAESLDTSLSEERKLPFRKIESKKIKIGYFSADFHAHPVSQLLARCIELHDREKFEIIAFSFDSSPEDATRARLRKAFDKFIEVSNLQGHEIAAIAQKMEVDIAIDLMGHTRNSRPEIFNFRASPIQASFLGYPGTTGCKNIDYIIADQTVIPHTHKSYYTEKIAYLPHSYLPNDPVEDTVTPTPTKASLGLPPDSFVYCCLNNTNKITPTIFKSWCKVLKAVPNSVLWLRSENIETQTNLTNYAKNFDLDPARLVFAQRTESHAEHLARYRVADLFLDTTPYNAHTTASDALWNDLPVLTCMGDSFASRVAGSLLRTLNIPELITESISDYVQQAIAFGSNPQKIQDLKSKLIQEKIKSSLFKPEIFTKNLESIYLKMVETYNKNTKTIDIHS